MVGGVSRRVVGGEGVEVRECMRVDGVGRVMGVVVVVLVWWGVMVRGLWSSVQVRASECLGV